MKAIGIVLLCLSYLSPYAQQESEKFKNEIFLKYDSSYIMENHKYVTKKDFDSGFIRPFKTEELRNVEIVSGKSKNLYKNKYRLYFRIYIYKYFSSTASRSTFAYLSKLNNLDDAIYFDKDFDYVFVKNNFIIRLDAPCLLSKQNWEILVKQILNISNKVWGNKIKYSSIECFCGGDCKVN